MGFLGDFFSGKDKSTSTSTYTPNVPQWLKDYYQSNTANAADLANATADERVAGFSQDQLSVQNALRGLLGQGSSNYQSGIDAVLGQLGGSAGNFGPDSYKPYMNPYINEVIQNQNNELVRTADISRNRIRDNAAMTNAFGSGRADLMEGELTRNLGQQVSENTASGMSSAFNWANNMALQADQNNTANTTGLAGALASLTGAQSNNVINQANALNSVGLQQQQLAQAQLDVPYNNVNWLSSILGQVPASIYGATTNNQTTTPGAGWGSQLLGAGIAAAGVMSGNPMLAAQGAGMTMKADGGLVTPASTNNSLRGTEQMLNNLNEQSLRDAMASKEEDSSTDSAGLQSLFSTLMAKSDVNKELGGINGQALNTTATMPVYAANGGLIVKFADGGAVSASPNSFIDMYRRIKGGYISPALESISDFASTLGKPAMVMDPATGQMVPNNKTEPTKAETQAAAYAGVDKSLIEENEAAMAKALADKQVAAPKTGPAPTDGDFMSDLLATGVLPPPRDEASDPTKPSSAVTDATQNVVNPTIESTDIQAAQSGPMSSIISKYLENQKAAAGSTDESKKASWMDNINLPMVLAGAAMMGSNRDFAGALSEGIGAGAQQVQRERSAKAEAEMKTKIASQENAQKLLDSMINAQYRDEQVRLGEQRAKISDRAVTVQEKQQAAKEKNASNNERKAMEFARKQTESEIKTFMMSPAALKMSQEQIDAMRTRLQQKYYNDFLSGSFGGEVVNELPTGVQLDLNDTSENTGGMLDYNALAAKYRQQ